MTIITLAHTPILASDASCSRTAKIRGENVAIDTSTTQKGEGLRYYLQKDQKALEYLSRYQDQQKPNWKRIGVSTIGVGLLIAGIFSSNDTNNDLLKRDTLLVTGATTVLLSYLYAKTKQSENEIWLEKSVKEYNKRQNPKIILNPHYAPVKKQWGVFLTREF